MASHSFSIEINSINIHKFGSLQAGLKAPNKDDVINLLPQVHEVSVFESLFEPVMKCELAIYDYIGMFTNYPLTGEEIIVIQYKNVGDDTIRKWLFAIENITDIVIENKNRATAYIITCSSIESLANSYGVIQKSFKGTTAQIAKQLIDEYINDRIKLFYPPYLPKNSIIEENGTLPMTLVVPALHPFAALDMIQTLSYSEVEDQYSYLFYQNSNGFNFRTIQSLIRAPNARRFAFNNKYKYFSDEINVGDSKMNNDDRVVSKIQFNKRYSSRQKLATGYFNNNLFEINIAQKAIHSTRSERDEINTIDKHDFNTKEFKDWSNSIVEGEEKSNRVRYAITTRAEHDNEFPIYRARERWGRDLISKAALSQVDLSIVIPGTNRFNVGDMFYLEIPEFHGFENMQTDDLVSGFYLITEIKQIIRIGGFQSTVMRINKDSYKSTVDRSSRYV